ncbi:MAG: Hsp20/alpha crystallin family protein [Deltaproteobacteria bacterium]|nr:Hsp20/alpha crystallin family protein [Deltaproteobacteria bacterium]
MAHNERVQQQTPQQGAGERTSEKGQVQTQGQAQQQQGLAQRGSTGTMARPSREYTSPFGLVGRMMEDMDRLFGNFGFPSSTRSLLAPWGEGGLGAQMQAWSPELDVFERDGNLVVRADLPGLKPEDVQVNVEDDVLTLKGERKDERETRREGYYYCERSYGRFERQVALPRGLDPNSIDAKFDNGVLEISAPIPKEQTRGRRIDVKSSGGGGKSGVQH